jgi:hypothetical protein
VTSQFEKAIAKSLRSCLADLAVGASIENSKEFQQLLRGLEFFLPAVLSKVYYHWKYESMDGLYLAVARKTAPREAELIGLCILISDQTLTPIHVRIRASEFEDQIEWLECKVGESGEGKGRMVRLPYDSSKQGKLLVTLPDRLYTLDWAYQVSIDERKANGQ